MDLKLEYLKKDSLRCPRSREEVGAGEGKGNGLVLDANSVVELGEVGIVLGIEYSQGNVKVCAVRVDHGVGVHPQLLLPLEYGNVMLLGQKPGTGKACDPASHDRYPARFNGNAERGGRGEIRSFKVLHTPSDRRVVGAMIAQHKAEP